MFKHILVASDLGEGADAPMKSAAELANTFGAALTALHVVDPLRDGRPWLATFTTPEVELLELIWTKEEGAAEESLKRRLAHAGPGAARAKIAVRRGPPSDVIAATAEEIGADLIVVGTHGRTGVKHAILGSVAERTVRTAGRPVLVVPTAS